MCIPWLQLLPLENGECWEGKCWTIWSSSSHGRPKAQHPRQKKKQARGASNQRCFLGDRHTQSLAWHRKGPLASPLGFPKPTTCIPTSARCQTNPVLSGDYLPKQRFNRFPPTQLRKGTHVRIELPNSSFVLPSTSGSRLISRPICCFFVLTLLTLFSLAGTCSFNIAFISTTQNFDAQAFSAHASAGSLQLRFPNINSWITCRRVDSAT